MTNIGQWLIAACRKLIRHEPDIPNPVCKKPARVTRDSKAKTIEERSDCLPSYTQSEFDTVLRHEQNNQVPESVTPVNTRFLSNLIYDFEREWMEGKSCLDYDCCHGITSHEALTDLECVGSSERIGVQFQKQVERHSSADVNPPLYNDTVEEAKLSCLATGWYLDAPTDLFESLDCQTHAADVPSHVTKYIPNTMPGPRGTTDEEFETTVVETVERHSQKLNVTPHTILKAISSCATALRDLETTWHTFHAMWLLKTIVIHRLSFIGKDFECARTALNLWLSVFESFDESAQAAFGDGMSLSIELLRRYLKAETSQSSLYGSGILHTAVRLRLRKLVSRLLAMGANPNAEDAYGITPFMWALRRNSHPALEENRHLILQALMNFGARPSLDTAIQADDYCALDLLTETRYGVDVDAWDENGETLLIKTIRVGDTKASRYLSLYRANPDVACQSTGNTALHVAVSKTATDNLASTILLLKKFKPSLNSQNKNGETPLHLLARDWSEIDVSGLRPLCLVALLLIHHADPTIQNQTGQTAAEIAKFSGWTKGEKMLRYAITHPEQLRLRIREGWRVPPLHLLFPDDSAAPLVESEPEPGSSRSVGTKI